MKVLGAARFLARGEPAYGGELATGKGIGAARFELATSCTRNKRATRLRYAPILDSRFLNRFCYLRTATGFLAGGEPAFWRGTRDLPAYGGTSLYFTPLRGAETSALPGCATPRFNEQTLRLTAVSASICQASTFARHFVPGLRRDMALRPDPAVVQEGSAILYPIPGVWQEGNENKQRAGVCSDALSVSRLSGSFALQKWNNGCWAGWRAWPTSLRRSAEKG